MAMAAMASSANTRLACPHPRHFCTSQLVHPAAWTGHLLHSSFSSSGPGIQWQQSPSQSKAHSTNKISMDIHALTAKINPATDLEPAEKKVLVPIANGSEEMEAVIIIDVLRRAGATVTVASVEGEHQIKASRGVNIMADTLISECEAQEYELVVLPGGMPGAERLRDSLVLKGITEKQAKSKRAYAAICAAPAVSLQSWGLLQGLHATCHPSFAGQLENPAAVESRVVRDNILTTSRGPGTAFEFALALVEQLYGAENVPAVSGPMVLPLDDGSETGKLTFNDEKWSTSAVPHVLVPVANGSEEMEVVIIVDILRRAGAEVVVASVERETTIIASRKVKLVADCLLSDALDTTFDLVVLPGGMPGAEALQKSEDLSKILKEQIEGARICGAICAAPAVVLEANGLLEGKMATCHPGFTSKLKDQSAVEGRVVIDGHIITSKGPGTAMEFALNIVEKLFGRNKAQELAEFMVFEYL